MIWAKWPQIESAVGQQTKGFEVFLIALSKANSLLKEKEAWACEKGQFIALPVKLWNGAFYVFYQEIDLIKIGLYAKTKYSAGKFWLLSSPLPLGKFKQDFLASRWEDFCQFYFLPEGKKQNNKCMQVFQQPAELGEGQEGRVPWLSASAHWVGEKGGKGPGRSTQMFTVSLNFNLLKNPLFFFSPGSDGCRFVLKKIIIKKLLGRNWHFLACSPNATDTRKLKVQLGQYILSRSLQYLSSFTR